MATVLHLTIKMHDGGDLNRASVAELLEEVSENFKSEVSNNSDEVVTADEEDVIDFDDHDDVRATLRWHVEVSK